MISVVIPVFNGAPYLRETIRSVKNSSYKDYEIILIDDGSTDESKKLCRELVRKNSKIRFFAFKKNRGLGHTLNFALKRAKGQYICRINQDDRMLRLRIETQVRFLNRNQKVSAVGSWVKLFFADGHEEILKFLPTHEEITKSWLMVSPFADPSVMYRRDIAIVAGGYQQQFWPADDTQLWYRMGIKGELANIQKPLVEVRFHKDAASVKHFRKLTVSLFNVHRWAHETVGPAPLWVQAFWIAQLVAGMTLTAEFNWRFYRRLKKIINAFATIKDHKLISPLLRFPMGKTYVSK